MYDFLSFYIFFTVIFLLVPIHELVGFLHHLVGGRVSVVIHIAAAEAEMKQGALKLAFPSDAHKLLPSFFHKLAKTCAVKAL